MSSDQLGIDTPPSRARLTRGYILLVVSVMLGLLMIAVVLAASLTTRGPFIRDVSLNDIALVTRENPRLVLEVDQPLAASSLDGVRVSPETPFEATLSGSRIQIRFHEPLRYGTEYSITTPKLHGTHTGLRSHAEYTFTTPPLSVYTLVRDASDSGRDSIVRHEVTSGTASVALEASKIQEYGVAADELAAVTYGEGGAARVVLVDLTGDETTDVELPGGGTVARLQGSGPTGYLGFIFTSGSADSAFTSVLFLISPDDATRTPRPVAALDGSPLQVADWRFVPGTSSLIAHSFDGSFYLVDATGATPPRLVGQHAELRRFIPGTTTVVAEDATGVALLDLSAGTARPVSVSEGELTEETSLLSFIDLDTFITAGRENDAMQAPVAAALTRVDADGAHPLVRISRTDGAVRDACVSPNREYIAIEVSPDGPLDGYDAEAATIGTRTWIVEISSGNVAARLDGILADWCR